MLSDLQLCQLLQAQYDNTPDVFDVTIDVSGVYCSVKHFDDCSIIAFRGSTTPLDFWRDFEGLMVQDAALGGVEQGFLTGLRDVRAHLQTLAMRAQIIIGHSLGAARALLYAGLMKANKSLVSEVVVFGAPRPGGQKLKDILAPVIITSYKNKGDPVTCVPFDLPPFESYCEPRDFTMLDVPPDANDDWLDVAPHRLKYYQKGLS